MSEGFESGEPGHYRVAGELTSSTVPGILEASQKELGDSSSISIDLSGVTRSDSSGVALLLEWRRIATRAGAEIRFSALPAQMRSIVEFSGLQNVLLEPTEPGQPHD